MSDELSLEKNSALIDPLTGLYNRHYLEQFVPQEIKKAGLGNYPLSLLMIDVDKFKKINDSYGHLSGDKALKHAAGIMKKTVRQNDTVIRYAGDEFMILLPGADRETTSVICKNLLSNIEKNKLTIDKDRIIDITLSIGYSVYPEDSGEQLKLIDMADKALYLSKKRGRNRFSSAKEVTVEEVSSLIAMESFPCRDFIDRGVELEKLKTLFDTVAGSKLPQAAFISGPSGVGRSRLLAEIKKYVKDKGSLIYCDASSPHAQDPYYLFAKGIDDYIDHTGIDNPRITGIISKMPPAELSELSLIMPKLRKLIKKSSDLNTEDTGRRFLLFEAFSDILAEMAALEPVLIIFDDIDWADKASLELLRYLIKHETSKNMFIACSFPDRPAGKAGGNALQALLKETSQCANASSISLANLSMKDTAAMMEAIFPGISKTKELSGLIYNATKGNPYFIEEMLKFLVEKGMILYQKDSWNVKDGIGAKEIPSSLNEIIKVRLTSLDDETKEMILQAAVIGKNFDADTLKKIGDKNEGFVSEILARAKNMHLVDEAEESGKFNFINENTQNILYGELNEAARNKLHYKIAQLLVNEHKDNLYDVAGEAAFHYSRAPGEEKAVKIGKELLEKASELFDPDEIRESLEQFTRELASKKEKQIVDLSDKAMKEATKFVLLVHGTMKKMRLYPPNSSVRLNTIKEVRQALDQIFLEVDFLVLTEVEKSLVINGKRLSPAEEGYAKAGEFLLIMREHGIKTISLKKGMREEELSNLINHFGQTRKEIADKGGWATVINKEALEHAGIDELHFISVDEYAKASPGKRPLHDFMLMEFLLGKGDQASINKEEIAHNIETNPQRIAQTIMDMANITAEKDKTRPDDAKVVMDVITKIDSQILEGNSSDEERGKDLAKVIMELEPALRNKVLDSFSSGSGEGQKKSAKSVMGAITDDFIIDMITEKYKDSMQNPLIVKEFVDDVLPKIGRKKEILAKLEPKLVSLGINKKDLAFVLGDSGWESLPVDRRIDMLLALPENYYSGSILNRIRNILEELESSGKKKDLTNTISRFLVKTKKTGDRARKNLLYTVSEFINMPSSGKKESSPQRESRLDSLFDSLESEADPAVFGCIIDIIKRSIDIQGTREGAPVDRNISLPERTFNLLIKRLKIEEGQRPALHEVIRNCIPDISSEAFIKILIRRLVDDTKKCTYNIKDLYFIFKDKLIDILVGLTTQKHMDMRDPFMEFVLKREIAGLLMELKDLYSSRLIKILSETRDDSIAPLIKLIGDLHDSGLIDPILPFAGHNDPAIRTAVVQALSEIGEARSIEILSKISREERDSNIRDLANQRLLRIKRRTPPQK